MRRLLMNLFACAAYANNIAHARHGDCPGIYR